MLEKRRTLELTYRINTWLFVAFFILSLFLFALGFVPSNEVLTSFLYKAILFLNVFYVIHSVFVLILVIIVRVNDKISSPKIVIVTIIRMIVSVVLTTASMLLQTLTINGV